MQNSHIQPTDDIFNSNDPRIKEDIIAIIMQYLQDEGYHASQSVLYDETNVKWKEREERTLEVKRLKKAILGKRRNLLVCTIITHHDIVDGDWQEVEKLCTKPLVKNHRSFLYSVYKQQYLEYLERREIQKVKRVWYTPRHWLTLLIGIHILEQEIKAAGTLSDQT